MLGRLRPTGLTLFTLDYAVIRIIFFIFAIVALVILGFALITPHRFTELGTKA